MPDGFSWDQSTFRDFGYIYTPHYCVINQCNVHFVFHGCRAAVDSVMNAGYNEFAANNNMIIVYPDAECWGYSGTLNDSLMFTKDGMMPRAIMAMMNRVTSANLPLTRLR